MLPCCEVFWYLDFCRYCSNVLDVLNFIIWLYYMVLSHKDWSGLGTTKFANLIG